VNEEALAHWGLLRQRKKKLKVHVNAQKYLIYILCLIQVWATVEAILREDVCTLQDITKVGFITISSSYALF